MTSETTRAVTNDDLWSAIRGLQMYRKTSPELRELARGASDQFASKVIAEAARQILAGRGIKA